MKCAINGISLLSWTKGDAMVLRLHWGWLILASCFLTVFTYFSIRMSYSILMPEMILSLGISKTRAAIIASSFFVIYTALAPFMGYWVDRVNARRLIPFFNLIHGAGTLGMGMASSFIEACLFFAVAGGGSAAMYVPVMTLAQRWFGPRYRGMALGILSMSWTLGYALMGLILPPLVERFQWRTCWFLLSILAFGMAPLNYGLIRSRPQELGLRPWGETPSEKERRDSSDPGRRLHYKEILRLPDLWIFTLSYFWMAFSVYIVTTFIVTYAHLELKLAYGTSAFLASAIAFSGMAGGLTIPLLSDRLGRRRCLILNNLLLAGSILPIPLVGDRSGALLVAVCIFGFFFTACWPIYAAAAGDRFPSEATGSVLGVWALFYGIAVMLGPTLGGYLADLTGSFRYPFYLAAFVAALGASLLFWVESKPVSRQ